MKKGKIFLMIMALAIVAFMLSLQEAQAGWLNGTSVVAKDIETSSIINDSNLITDMQECCMGGGGHGGHDDDHGDHDGNHDQHGDDDHHGDGDHHQDDDYHGDDDHHDGDDHHGDH